MSNDLIAAFDVGKTHTRLAVIEPHSCTEVWHIKRVNQVQDTALGRQLDVANIEVWLIDALRQAPGRIEPSRHRPHRSRRCDGPDRRRRAGSRGAGL